MFMVIQASSRHHPGIISIIPASIRHHPEITQGVSGTIKDAFGSIREAKSHQRSKKSLIPISPRAFWSSRRDKSIGNIPGGRKYIKISKKGPKIFPSPRKSRGDSPRGAFPRLPHWIFWAQKSLRLKI